MSGNFSSNKSNQAIGARTYCFVPAGSKFILQAKAVDQKDKVNLLELESSLEQLDCIGFFFKVFKYASKRDKVEIQNVVYLDSGG